jgi:putative FmdB family regulatory protein
MPLYEYKCEECETVSEFRMKMSDPHPEACPECGAGSLRKLISQTAFQLKGGGWYNEGYTGPSNKKQDSNSKAKDASDSGSSDSSAANSSGSGDKSSKASSTKSTGTE